MTIQQEILEHLATLRPAEQEELLRIARSLSQRSAITTAQPRKGLMGAFAGRGIDVTAEDIDDARREMWADFPRGVK
jgi:hypothetical protein